MRPGPRSLLLRARLSWGLACLLAGVALIARPAPAQEAAKPKLKAESSSEAVAMYGDAANFQNNNAFELAADEWDKFLKKFPDDPLVPKAQHYAGVCNLQLKRLPQAAAAFQATISKYDKFELTEDAYLNLGWCQFTLAGQGQKELYPTAIETFAALQKQYPKSKYTDQALFFQAESLVAVDKKNEALAPYQRMITEFPESSLRCDGLYALGVTHEELGQYAEAGKIYDLFLKECGENELATEVRMRKAETILQAGQFDAAEKLFAEVAAVPGFGSADHALFRRAFCLAKLDKFGDAAAIYAGIPQDYPKSVYQADATMSAARSYYRAEQFDKAAPWLEKVIEADTPDATEAAHWLCRILLKQQQPAKVVALADKVTTTADPGEYLPSLLMDRADALFEIPERRAEAIDQYVKVAAAYPEHSQAPQALYGAAFTALDLKQFDNVLVHVAAFKKAYGQDKLLPDVKYVEAEAHLQGGAADKAEAPFRDLIENYPDHPDHQLWQVRLGLSLYLQKKYDETVALFTDTAAKLQSADNRAEAWFLTGASQFHSEKYDEAAKSLAAALEANPEWRQADETLLYLSRASRKLNQLDAAKATVKKLIADFPDSPLLDQAHFRLGEYTYTAADYPNAIVEYGRVAEKWPQSTYTPYALYGKGWAQLKLKEYAQAAATFTQLLEGFPEHPLLGDTQFARAMCRRQTGMHKEAIEDLEAYLKTSPEIPGKSDAMYERGLAEVALGEHASAVATFTGLLDLNAKYAAADKVRYELAWAHKSLKEDEKAAEQFLKLATEFPESPLAAEANFHVGERLYDQKQYDQAIKPYAQAVARSDTLALSEKALYKLGWSHFQQKQYEPALAQFEKQVQEHADGPLFSDGLFMKGESLFRLEKYAEALPVFEQASQVKLSSPQIETLVLLHGGQAAAQQKQWDKSLQLLAPILEKFPDSPYVPQALYDIGWAKQNQGKTDEAIKDYEQAATKSRGEVGARSRFMIGELLFADKKYDEAGREFQRVMFGFGGQQATDDVKTWQAKSGFEAARCAEVQIKDQADAQKKAQLVDDARKFYSYVVEQHPKSDLVEQAKTRLAALEKL